MITAEQVTALTAQAAAAAAYNPYDLDNNLLPGWELNDNNIPVYLGSEIANRGIGIYGQTPAGLTLTGYLKSGTLNLITSPELTSVVLNTPAVWTGQQGINSLLDYLNNPILQNLVQIEIMQGAFQGLIDAGILVGNESARYQATFLQPATQYGVDAVVSWVQGEAQGVSSSGLISYSLSRVLTSVPRGALSSKDRTLNSELVNKIKIAARQGQYAIDFINTFALSLNAGVDSPGFINTVDRQELDQTLTEIIGNEKIPSVDYADIVPDLPDFAIPVDSDEEGIFRFAPGKPKA